MSALMKTEATKTRAGTGVRERGAARVDEIIQTTKKILVNDGLADLSTRRVARELGISIGNLHYYFSTKNDLLKAVIEDVIRGYDEEFERKAKLFPNAPRKRIEAFVRYLIADAKKPEVRAFFYQLWGMSVQNNFAADLRDKAYSRFVDMMVDMLAPLHPDKSIAELKSLAMSINAPIEGLHVTFGLGKEMLEQYPEMDELLFQQIMRNIDYGCSNT